MLQFYLPNSPDAKMISLVFNVDLKFQELLTFQSPPSSTLVFLFYSSHRLHSQRELVFKWLQKYNLMHVTVLIFSSAGEHIGSNSSSHQVLLVVAFEQDKCVGQVNLVFAREVSVSLGCCCWGRTMVRKWTFSVLLDSVGNSAL